MFQTFSDKCSKCSKLCLKCLVKSVFVRILKLDFLQRILNLQIYFQFQVMRFFWTIVIVAQLGFFHSVKALSLLLIFIVPLLWVEKEIPRKCIICFCVAFVQVMYLISKYLPMKDSYFLKVLWIFSQIKNPVK